MVPNPHSGGHNVRGLSPVVDICVGPITDCANPLAHFTAGDEHRRDHDDDECREHSGRHHEDGDDDRDGHHGPYGFGDGDEHRHGKESCESPDECRDGDEDNDDDHDGHHHHGDEDKGRRGDDELRGSEDHYLVDWHTGRLSPGTYRVSVRLRGELLGFADVKVVGRAKDLKSIDLNQYVGLLAGQTLPIKFRIEKGAVKDDCGTPPPPLPATISGTDSNYVFATRSYLPANGYHVYLFLADAAGNATGAPLADTTTNLIGTFTFTSGHFLAGTRYVVCEANPYLLPPPFDFSSEFLPLEVLPPDVLPPSGVCDASYAVDYGTSLYAQLGYLVTAPAAGDLPGNDFKNVPPL
jgi:hypothetical protein